MTTILTPEVAEILISFITRYTDTLSVFGTQQLYRCRWLNGPPHNLMLHDPNPRACQNGAPHKFTANWRCMSQTLVHVRMEHLTNSPQTDAACPKPSCMSEWSASQIHRKLTLHVPNPHACQNGAPHKFTTNWRCVSQTLRSGRLPACMPLRADLAKTLPFPGSHLGGACSCVLSCSSAPVFFWCCFFVLFSFVHICFFLSSSSFLSMNNNQAENRILLSPNEQCQLSPLLCRTSW